MLNGTDQHFSLMQVGHCRHPEAMIAQGRPLKSIIFPAIVALLKHPIKGYLLFDTGYACHFHTATSRFPEKLYRLITPVTFESSHDLKTQLLTRGVKAEEITAIFISHFHADHIAGLHDFPNARFICSQAGFEFINGRRSRFYKLTKGTLPALLPNDFYQRTDFIEHSTPCSLPGALQPFEHGYDLFGGGYCIAVNLPGHARGHFGLLFNSPGQKPYFLIGDACWTIETLAKQLKPNRLSHLLLDDAAAYFQTISQLHYLLNSNPDLNLIPSHCQQTLRKHEPLT